MQLVSIFSTILLGVATIVLAVAAYFLYTIRERLAHMERLCKQAPAASIAFADVPGAELAASEPEVAAPEPAALETVVEEPEVKPDETHVPPEPQASIMTPATEKTKTSPMTIFWEYTDEGFVPVEPISPEPEADSPDDDTFAWL